MSDRRGGLGPDDESEQALNRSLIPANAASSIGPAGSEGDMEDLSTAMSRWGNAPPSNIRNGRSATDGTTPRLTPVDVETINAIASRTRETMPLVQQATSDVILRTGQELTPAIKDAASAIIAQVGRDLTPAIKRETEAEIVRAGREFTPAIEGATLEIIAQTGRELTPAIKRETEDEIARTGQKLVPAIKDATSAIIAEAGNESIPRLREQTVAEIERIGQAQVPLIQQNVLDLVETTLTDNLANLVNARMLGLVPAIDRRVAEQIRTSLNEHLPKLVDEGLPDQAGKMGEQRARMPPGPLDAVSSRGFTGFDSAASGEPGDLQGRDTTDQTRRGIRENTPSSKENSMTPEDAREFAALRQQVETLTKALHDRPTQHRSTGPNGPQPFVAESIEGPGTEPQRHSSWAYRAPAPFKTDRSSFGTSATPSPNSSDLIDLRTAVAPMDVPIISNQRIALVNRGPADANALRDLGVEPIKLGYAGKGGKQIGSNDYGLEKGTDLRHYAEYLPLGVKCEIIKAYQAGNYDNTGNLVVSSEGFHQGISESGRTFTYRLDAATTLNIRKKDEISHAGTREALKYVGGGRDARNDYHAATWHVAAGDPIDDCLHKLGNNARTALDDAGLGHLHRDATSRAEGQSRTPDRDTSRSSSYAQSSADTRSPAPTYGGPPSFAPAGRASLNNRERSSASRTF